MQRAARRADEDERRARKWQQQQQRREQQDRGLGQAAASQTFGWGFGNGEVGGDNTYTPPVHGTTADGRPVTASFGRAGGRKDGHTFLRDGHAQEYSEFYGPQGHEQHDHYGSGNGRNDNGTERGKYTGYGS